MKISIDGNIGSGKSALIQHLQDVFSSRDDIEFFPEPIDEWMPLFQMYMTNKKRYAPLFTLEVLRSFGRVKYSTRRHQIIERHPCTTMHVFNNILKNDGHIQSDDLGLIEDYYDLFGWVPDMILYIQVDDTTCIDRIEHRGRRACDFVSP
jgi:deoxyadenosine/deoxycytidine kinase